MTALRAAADAVHAFLHADEPATTVAVFRVWFGVVLLANALLLLRDARLWFGETGVLPRRQHREIYGRSPFMLLTYLPPSDTWVFAMLATHLLAVVLLIIGLATRVSAAVACVTLVTLHQRNPLMLYGADYVMRLMCFLLIFSRAGETLSLDRWIAVRSGDVIVPATAWCTRLMQLQVSIIYLKAGLSKLRGGAWRQGDAVYYAVEAAEFRRAHFPRVLAGRVWLRAATWGTVATECALGTLVWIREVRYPALAAGVALHLLMEGFMNLQLFGATMIACLTLFIDPQDLERLLRILNLHV